MLLVRSVASRVRMESCSETCFELLHPVGYGFVPGSRWVWIDAAVAVDDEAECWMCSVEAL